MVKIVEPQEAVAQINDGSHLVFPGSCANPVRFYEAFSKDIGRLSALTVCSGLSLGDYQFLETGLGTNFHYKTSKTILTMKQLSILKVIK